MALPPPALLPILSQHPGEAFIGAALTADVHVFPPARIGEIGRSAPVWLAATDARLWLCAWDPVKERAWATATGDARQVTLTTGWQRDVLSVGPYRCRLRRSSRREVAALLQTWRSRRPAGDPFPERAAIPAKGAPIAKGAPELPEPLAVAGRGLDTVPSGLQEAWLAAIPTDASWPVHPFEGPTTTPLVLACSDLRNAIVALHPDGAPATVHPLPPTALPLENKAWKLGDTLLKPKGSTAIASLLDLLLAIEDPAERWSLAARHALVEGEPGRALELLAEAFSRGKAERCWTHLVQLCLALEQGNLGASVGWMAIREDPELDVEAIASLHSREAIATTRSVLRDRLMWTEVRSVGAALFDAVAPAPNPPDDLPWPPVGPAETWATALAMHGRYGDARLIWATTEAGPRRAAAMAVLSTAQGLDSAPDAWIRAAGLARKAGGDGYLLLAKAVALRERPLDRWRWGAWAWRDGRVDTAREQWSRALELDDGGGIFAHTVDIPGLACLAELAEGSGRLAVAERVYQRMAGMEPEVLAHRTRVARVAEADGRPGDAAHTLEEAARALDAETILPTDEARWTLWVEVARLHHAAGRPSACAVALHEALVGDFLDLDAWEAALATESTLPPSLRGWWQHIFRVLAGESAEEGAPIPPLDAIDDASLDGLHPGGAGWLAGLRGRLDPNEPPNFTALTRGLDRLREADFTEAAETVESVSELLQLADPPTGHVFRGVGAWGLSAWPSKPPALLIGVQHLKEGERALDGATLRFALSAELVHLRCDHPVLTFDADWLGTSRSVYDQVNRYAGTAETVFDLVTLLPGLDQARKIQTLFKLTRTAFKARGAVDKAVALADPVVGWLGLGGEEEARGLSRENLSGAALQFRIQAERAALLLTGDLRAATEALFTLSTRSTELLPRARAEGLVAILNDPESGLSGDEILRLSALVAFATSHMPWQATPAPPG